MEKDKIILEPHDWFCTKFGIDILEERLSLIEHKGRDVISFIEQYVEYTKTGIL